MRFVHIFQYFDYKTEPRQDKTGNTRSAIVFGSSRYLDTCNGYNEGQLTSADLVAATVKLGFNNVIDAFHVVNRDVVPVRFFVDERSSGGGIRITD